MSTNTHVDFSEVVIDHFARYQEIHPDVFELSRDRFDELVDAIPEDERNLLDALKELRRRI